MCTTSETRAVSTIRDKPNNTPMYLVRYGSSLYHIRAATPPARPPGPRPIPNPLHHAWVEVTIQTSERNHNDDVQKTSQATSTHNRIATTTGDTIQGRTANNTREGCGVCLSIASAFFVLRGHSGAAVLPINKFRPTGTLQQWTSGKNILELPKKTVKSTSVL